MPGQPIGDVGETKVVSLCTPPPIYTKQMRLMLYTPDDACHASGA